MPPVPHPLPRPQEVEIVAESFRQFTLEAGEASVGEGFAVQSEAVGCIVCRHNVAITLAVNSFDRLRQERLKSRTVPCETSPAPPLP